MSQLTVIAHIYANPGHEAEVKAELEKLLPITRAEDGCINYDLHTDNADPTHFVFHENWASKAALKNHLSAPHLKAYMKAVDGKIRDFTLNEMTPV